MKTVNPARSLRPRRPPLPTTDYLIFFEHSMACEFKPPRRVLGGVVSFAVSGKGKIAVYNVPVGRESEFESSVRSHVGFIEMQVIYSAQQELFEKNEEYRRL